MYHLVVRDWVLIDLEEEYWRYEIIVPGLGERFLKEWDDFCEHVVRFPFSFPLYRNRIRQGRFHKFPYLIMYELYDDDIVVFNVIHNKQRPSKRTHKKK